MADTKISALTELAITTDDADEFAIVDDSATTTKRITFGGLRDSLAGRLTVNTVGTTGSTETLTSDDIQRMTMDQNCLFTFPTVTGGHGFILHLSGAFTPSFPASVDWDSAGGAPTYATPSWYTFITSDSGTTWLGTLVASGLG